MAHDWQTPEIRAAQERIDQAADAARELAARVEKEGLPMKAEPQPPVKKRDDDDDEDNVVLRHSSW